MSRTSTPACARVAKIAEVTPGRSLPASVMSRVSGCLRRLGRSSRARGYRRRRRGLSVAGSMRRSHDRQPTTRSTTSSSAWPTWRRPQAFYEQAFGWEFNDYGPDYAGIRAPDGEGEVGGLGAGPTAGPGRRRWCSSTPTTSTPAVAAVEAAGGSRHRGGPTSIPGGRRFLFTDPSGNELRSARPSAPRLSRAATPRASRPRPGRAGRRGRGPQRGPPRSASPALTRAAVVLQGEVDDRRRLQGPARRARRSAAACPAGRQPRAGAQVHQLVGDLGPPAGHVEVGERRPRSRSSAPAQRAVGLADVGQLARGAASYASTRPAPTRRGTSPRRAGEHDRLARLQGGGVEARAGRRGPTGSPGAGSASPSAGGPVGAQLPEGRDQRALGLVRARAARRPRGSRRRRDRVDGEVGDHVRRAATPCPTRRGARTAGRRGGHGGVTRREVTPGRGPAASLGLPPWPPSSSSPT